MNLLNKKNFFIYPLNKSCEKKLFNLKLLDSLIEITIIFILFTEDLLCL